MKISIHVVPDIRRQKTFTAGELIVNNNVKGRYRSDLHIAFAEKSDVLKGISIYLDKDLARELKLVLSRLNFEDDIDETVILG